MDEQTRAGPIEEGREPQARGPALLDAMRDAGVERLRFKRVSGGVKTIAAYRDAGWEKAAELLPGCEEDLAWVRRLMEQGGHERLDLVYRDEVGLRFFCAVHSTAAGPGAGGLRRHELSIPEGDVVRDVLNLARAMSYKNLVAGLGRGGSKLCVHNPDIPGYAREEWLACLAEEIDLSGTITGPDSGYEGWVFQELSSRTSQVSGVHGGGTARFAAAGVMESLKATCAALGLSLGEAHMVVQGLGRLGAHLADDLARAGARLTVTDRDHRRIDAFLSGLPADTRENVQVVAPYQVLDAEAQVLVPCAMGRVIGAGNAGALKVRAVCGGANNQLDADSLEEELAISRRLLESGVLFVPDWLASAGGAIHGVMEMARGEDFDPRQALARIHRTCGWMVDEVLTEAKRSGHTPLEVAVERHLGPLLGE